MFGQLDARSRRSHYRNGAQTSVGGTQPHSTAYPGVTLDAGFARLPPAFTTHEEPDMEPNQQPHNSVLQFNHTRLCIWLYLTVVFVLFLPGVTFGQSATETIDTTCQFASNINKILNAVSIIVVTIAVVFSGYQIAFAHKRIGDIAPVLIGAILIGAAGQIAKMFLAGSTSASGASACTASLMAHVLNFYA